MVGGLRLVALAALVTLGSCCENPFLQIGSECLFFGSSFSFDYTASADFCTALNGRLVTIDNTQKLRDIVDYTTNNLTQDYSYWVDGTDVQGTWLFADGTTIPQGTPYWATFSVNSSGYGQEPRESPQQGTNCLAIKHPTSYYFVSNDCSDSISPLCEQMTGTSSSVRTTSSCGGELTASSGEVTSPNYPSSAPAPTDCIWTITRGVDSVIRITINDVDIHNAGGGDTQYLSIRDGSASDSTELGHYWGHTTVTPVTLATSGNHAWINFVTVSGGFKGVSMTYNTVWQGDCNIDYNSETGSVRSPLYPEGYSPNLDCSWSITVKEGYYVALTVFNFDTESDDIVQIRDGSNSDATLLEELSGSVETGHEIASSTNKLYLTFKSDDNTDGAGFAFTWTSRELCPTPYLNVGKLCIHFELNDLTFGLSGIACQEESGELAAINDPQDLRDLYLFLQNQGIADTSFWLGGSDQAEEGVWRWEDGSLVPSGTPFWGTTGGQSEVQEPDGGASENCLLLASNGMHYFRDEACNKKAPAICMLSAQ